MQWLVQVISSLVNVQVNVERFTKLMETESDVRDTPEVTEKYGDAFHPKKENWEPLYGDIEFQDVTFRYPDGSENVLEHFSLKVPQGTNVAIVGETGAGKSTLVNLVCRFFEPTEGRVLIDGRDARARSQLWLHSNIGYVLQTPHLFSGTVLENLRYGRPDATMDEIEAAVKAVSADQIIARLPDGYDSDIGEGGNTLSTGEKQLLSFARALLADPLYASLSLLIAHILSLPLSPLTPSEMLLCELPAVELPAATAVAQAIPRLFEASKGVLGETKVGLIVRSINSILTQLARFGPSVIATLIKNGSGGSPVF